MEPGGSHLDLNGLVVVVRVNGVYPSLTTKALGSTNWREADSGRDKKRTNFLAPA